MPSAPSGLSSWVEYIQNTSGQVGHPWFMCAELSGTNQQFPQVFGHFPSITAETHRQPVRSTTSYGAPPVFLFVSHGEVAWMDSTATDLAPRAARKSLNSFEVQPGHRAGTSCWQGTGLAEPHFMPCASAEGVEGESTSSLRDRKHFLGMVPRF